MVQVRVVWLDTRLRFYEREGLFPAGIVRKRVPYFTERLLSDWLHRRWNY